MPSSIELLKKVCLRLSAGNQKGMNNLADSVDFQFILGVASDGLTPFEASLLNKESSWNYVIEVSAHDIAIFFGYLKLLIQDSLSITSFPKTLFLTITIMDVVTPSNMEIVQAIAKATAHGSCGGSCDCGCS